MNKVFKLLFKICLFSTILSFNISFADNISDFQIEGISIGDGILEYASEQELISNKFNYIFKNNKFFGVNLDKIIPMRVYDGGGIFLKTYDKEFIVHSVYGEIFYPNNIEDCYANKDKIFADLITMFEDITINDAGTHKHNGDPYGKSKATSVWFKFESGGSVGIYCMDWGKEMEKERNYTDHLRVTINSAEYNYWLNNEAY